MAVLKGMITPSIMGAAGGASTFVAVMRGNAVLVATAAGTVSFIARLGMGLVPGSIDELHGLIRSKWATDMELGLPIPTHYDNAPFDKPEDARWVRLRILTDDSVHVAESSAGHVFRNLGIMQANVYVPIEGGDTPAHEVADAIAAAFDDVAINSELLFRQTRIDGALRQADEWRVSVTTPFQHTVTNTKLSSVSGDSTTFEEIANHIRERYSDEITTAESIPTQFDNAPFDIPEASLWSSLTVQFGDRVTSELGATLRKRVVGNIVGAVFVPIETGERDGLRAADKVKDAFRTVTIKGVTFRAATVRNVGRVGPWWQINATVPFLVHP